MSLLAALSPRRLKQLWYVPLLVSAMALMLVRTLLLARILDVPSFGAFSAGLLVSSSFCMLACLGLQPMLQRDLPVMVVRRRLRPGAVLLAQCIVVACCCAAVGALVALAGLPVAGLSRALLLVGLLHGLSQQLFLIASVESRSRAQPVRFARQNFVRGAAVLMGGSAVALAGGSALFVLLTEAAVSLMLTQATLVAVFRAAAVRARLAYRLAWRRLPLLDWAAAFALLLVTVAGFLLVSADRWVAAQSLQPAQFAQYAFAWTVLMIAQSLQVVVNASVYPMLARRFATQQAAGAFRVCVQVSLVLLGACLAGALPTWWLLDLAVTRWYAAYAPALPLLPLFIAIAALRLSDFWSSFMVIVGRERQLLALNIGAGLTALVVWLVWSRPWSGSGLALWDIAVLGALFAVCNHAAVALSAWRIGRVVNT